MAQCFYLIGALNYYAKKDTGSNSEKIDEKKRFYISLEISQKPLS